MWVHSAEKGLLYGKPTTATTMRERIMIMTNLKLHHDWWEDWAGAHMREVGNNWRITLRMRYKKKARVEVLECRHGAAWHSESRRFVNISPKGRCKRGFKMAKN